VIFGVVLLAIAAVVVGDWLLSSPGHAAGSAWLVRNSGDSIVQRGLVVYLLPEDVPAGDAGPVYRERIKYREQDQGEDQFVKQWKSKLAQLGTLPADGVVDSFSLCLLYPFTEKEPVVALDTFIRRRAISSTNTGADGKYRLAVPPGRYTLFAVADTSLNRILWARPITVLRWRTTEVDLWNNTAAWVWNN